MAPIARHPDAHAAAFDFDFRKACLFQQSRPIAHDIGIDTWRSLAFDRRGNAAEKCLGFALAHFALSLAAPTSSAMASTASRYPVLPSPAITPLATWLTKSWWRNGSRCCGLDRCTSMIGRSSALNASNMAMEVWE